MTKKRRESKATLEDIQVIGHMVGSLAGVIVIGAVDFGLPLTPSQQASILSVITVSWALFSAIYGIKHGIHLRGGTPDTTPRPLSPRGAPHDPTTVDEDGHDKASGGKLT